jgi:hypothetical protein
MAQPMLRAVQVCTLERTIAAIRVRADSGPRVGLFTELPAGAVVEVYDAGFNDATVKVRLHDEFYFVFRQDIGL